MEKTLDFADLLRLIDERSGAFRAAIAAAPSLDVPVPSCPGWTLADLQQHLVQGRRKWAAIVAAGPADAPPDKSVWETSPEDQDLAAATQDLLDALTKAGPDGRCWTWWDRSVSPETAGAVARHQVQELTVHTYDAQLALGDPQPLPVDIALDGVDEFLLTCCAGDYHWPYEPASVAYYATEGRSWWLTLAADGVRIGTPDGTPDVSAEATAGELVLFFYNRVSMDDVKVVGDRRIFEQLIAWDPDA